MTAPLVQLLETHYVVAYAGASSASDRTAQVVEARRADGSLAARFWLDDATKLPLEREVYDTAAHVISRDVFINVRLAKQGSAPASAPADPQGLWTDPFSQAQLLALRARGWLVPAQLPGGLSLFTGAETEANTGTVLDLGYSDGLSVISVFEQRGQLAASLAGWRKTTVAGHVIFVAEPDQRSLTWSGARHGVHGGGGRADPDRGRGGRRAAARQAAGVLEAHDAGPGPAGVLGQSVRLTLRAQGPGTGYQAPVRPGSTRKAAARFRVDRERVFTCPTES